MEVYEISARFMRRIQAKEYEPAEAEVQFKANLAEGEDYTALAAELMANAKSTVIESGLKSGKATAETTAEAPKNKGGRPPKETLVPPAPKTEAAKPAATPKPEPTPAPVAAPAAEPDEFGEFDTPAAEPEKPMAAKELQEWITAHLQTKKIDTSTVKAILGKYGAARTMDTKEEDRLKIKADVEAALKK